MKQNNPIPSQFRIEDDVVMEYFGNGGHVVVPHGVKDIFFDVFSYNYQITSLTIPGTISSVTIFAFQKCTGLLEAVLEEGVGKIEFNAFDQCTALQKVVLPQSLQEIAMYAFRGCTSLTQICFCGTEQQWKGINKHDGWDKESCNYTVVFNYKQP